MKNVSRISCPPSLASNCKKWENDLKKEIKRCQRTGEKVTDRFYNKYNKKDVKESLTKMYNNYCCYCESRINVVDFPHIEHRIPKRKYPDKCYEWSNLHLACTQCNLSKGDKYDIESSILDAVVDNPIDNHLTYEWSIDTIIRWPKTERGETTINHTDLNRADLCGVRFVIFCEVMKIIKEINKRPNTSDSRFKKAELSKKINAQYGSIIKWAMDNYLNN